LEVDPMREIISRYCEEEPETTMNTEDEAGSKPAISDAKAEQLLNTPVAASVSQVDVSKLDELTGGDTEFLMELVQAFNQSALQIIDELQQASAKQDRTAIGRAAHKLKGASANMQISSIRELCAALEGHAATMSEDALHAHLQQLQSGVTAVISELDNIIKLKQSAA